MNAWLDLLGSLFLLAGAALSLVAAVALVRFPDLLTKMHAITKPQVLGLLLVAVGISLSLRTWWVLVVCGLMVALQLVTSPVSATMVSRAAYRTGMVDQDLMVLDELADDLAGAGFQLAHPQEPSGTPEAVTAPRPVGTLLNDTVQEPVGEGLMESDPLFEGQDPQGEA